MKDHTLFDFSVGVSFYAGDGLVWYEANVYTPDSFLPPPARVHICTMGGHLGNPPSFPAGTQMSEEMKQRITLEVNSKIQPAWEKLLAAIAEDRMFIQADEKENNESSPFYPDDTDELFKKVEPDLGRIPLTAAEKAEALATYEKFVSDGGHGFMPGVTDRPQPPEEHVCDDYMCAECGTDKLLTKVEVAERNLREGPQFHETPEEWELECQKWRAVIAKDADDGQKK